MGAAVIGKGMQGAANAKFGTYKIIEEAGDAGYNIKALRVPSTPQSFYIHRYNRLMYTVYWTNPGESRRPC